MLGILHCTEARTRDTYTPSPREVCNFYVSNYKEADSKMARACMAANYTEPRRRFNAENTSRLLPNQIAVFEGAGL